MYIKQAKIYALMDPRNTHDIYYGGGTIQELKKRLDQHIWDSTRKTSKNYPVHRWIQSLIAEGIKPVIELLCVCDTLDYTDDEIAWIAFLWANWHPLTNVRAGGQLGFNGKHSKISRERMSKSGKGKHSAPKTKEHRENISKSKLGDKNPMKNKTHTEESKKKIGMAAKGNTYASRKNK